MLGIALEGGGAKGAFHIGALQACFELGLSYDVIAGSSIGAINAALCAQGDFEEAKAFWLSVSNYDLFLPEEAELLHLLSGQRSIHALASARDGLKALIERGGMDISRITAFIHEHIDPEKLLRSPVDFGLVTVSLSDRKPIELFKDQIPPEHLLDYIMASASFPGFQQLPIGEKKFLDGGVYDNCPVNMLLDRGCDKVIAIRTYAVGITRIPKENPNVITISPSEDLGPHMLFSPEKARYNITLGYYDAMRVLKGYSGQEYYIAPMEKDQALSLFLQIPDDVLFKAARKLRLPQGFSPKRALFEEILPTIAGDLKLKKLEDYNQIFIGMLENRAKRLFIPRLRLYSTKELFTLTLQEKISRSAGLPFTGKKAEALIDLLMPNIEI